MCRRCSECVGMTHHWIEGDDFTGDNETGGPEYVCKHCECPGRECDHCGGDGCLDVEDDDLCPLCSGEGVVEVRGELLSPD